MIRKIIDWAFILLCIVAMAVFILMWAKTASNPVGTYKIPDND